MGLYSKNPALTTCNTCDVPFIIAIESKNILKESTRLSYGPKGNVFFMPHRFFLFNSISYLRLPVSCALQMGILTERAVPCSSAHFQEQLKNLKEQKALAARWALLSDFWCKMSDDDILRGTVITCSFPPKGFFSEKAGLTKCFWCWLHAKTEGESCPWKHPWYSSPQGTNITRLSHTWR